MYLYSSKIIKSIVKANACHYMYTNYLHEYYFLICNIFGIFMYRPVFFYNDSGILRIKRLRNFLSEKCCKYFSPLLGSIPGCTTDVVMLKHRFITKLNTRWHYKPPKLEGNCLCLSPFSLSGFQID